MTLTALDSKVCAAATPGRPALTGEPAWIITRLSAEDRFPIRFVEGTTALVGGDHLKPVEPAAASGPASGTGRASANEPRSQRGPRPVAGSPRRRPLRLVAAALMSLALLAGTAMASGVSASAATDRRSDWTPVGPEWAWIQALCADFLGHAPRPEDLSFFDKALGSKTVPEVVTQLAESPAAVKLVVNQLYVDTFGRPGDGGGLAYWTNQIELTHGSVEQLLASFYSSNEFYPGSDYISAGWLNRVYQAALGRPAFIGWMPYFIVRGPRAPIALRIVQSAEARGRRVDALYRRILRRGADPAGRRFWVSRFPTEGDIAVSADLASGLEYLNVALAHFAP